MLRKRFIIVLMVLFGLSIMGGKVHATDKVTTTSTINGVTVNWEYNVNNGNVANLVCKNVSDLSGKITIPSTIDGMTVESLGFEAFKSATGITEVIIPSTIRTIGSDAFRNCTGLTGVDLGSVETFGGNAFMGCTALESVTIPKTAKDAGYYYAIFNGCTNLTEILFEDGLTTVPAHLCQSTNITSIDIPNSVKSIQYEAFRDCAELKKITILDNVTSIAEDVFKNHNEDLTIYCYEGSVAAKYAIDNNIKYVYLKRATVEELTATVTYNPTSTTTGTVTATVKTNKKVNEVDGWTLSTDGKTLTKTYSENKTETVQLKDIDGKTKDVEIKITNIITTATENKSDTQDSVKGKEDLTLTPETNLPKTGSNTIIITVIGATILLFAVAVYNKFKKYKGI